MAAPAEPGRSVTGRTTTRVRYPETDRMGVAHHTQFLVWFELGRTELMRDLGCPYGKLEEEEEIFFPVIRLEAAYHAPARYDEELAIATRLVSVGGARVKFEYIVSRKKDDTTLATGSTEHAAVGRTGSPRRLPEGLRCRLTRVREGGE